VTNTNFARLISSVVFYALLVIIVLVAIPYGTVQTPWKALFACCVFALTILSLIEGVLSGSLLTRAHLLLLPLVALIIFCFAQTIRFGQREVAGISAWQSISADPFQTRLVALNLLTLLLAWGLLLRYTTTTWRLRALIYTIIGVGVASALFGLIRQTTQQADAAGFILPNLRSGYGQFINRNHFAFMMEMAASGGLVGVALLGWFLVMFIRNTLGHLRRANSFARAASIGALTGIFGVVIHSFVDFGLHININALLCIALLVIATGDVTRRGGSDVRIQPRIR
jgi:hypothetical protein